MKPFRNRAQWLFFRQWLRNPFSIGAVMPSGRELARAMARASGQAKDGHGDGLVIELGGGTGSITQALLESGIDPERLIVVERDPKLYRVLKARFPRLRLVRGDACEVLAQLRAELKDEDVTAIVSGLPLLSMAPAFQERLLQESFRLLMPGGDFIQFTYGPVSPVPQRRLSALGLKAERVGRARLNIPPASVWRFLRLRDWVRASRNAALAETRHTDAATAA